MQALKDHEDALRILGVNPNAVIPDGEEPLALFPFGPDMHLGRLLATELEGVADQVLEDLSQLSGIGQHGWEGGAGHHRPILLDRHLQVGERLVQDRLAVDGFKGLAAGRHPRIGQQVIDQGLHPFGAVHGIRDELVGIRIEVVLIAFLEEL